MTWAAVAVGGGSAIAGIASGMFGASSAAKSANAYKEAAQINQNTAFGLEERGAQRLAPYTDLGKQAAGIYGNILSGQQDLSKVVGTSPLYMWQSEMGQRALDRQLAQRGLSNTGAGLELNRQFQAQLLGDESSRYMSYLTNAAQIGESAAAQGVSSATSLGNAAMNSNMAAANGVAQSNINQGVAYGNIATSVANAGASGVGTYLNQQNFNNLMARLPNYSQPQVQAGISMGDDRFQNG